MRHQSYDFQSWQWCGSLSPVYLCSTAGPQEMRDRIKDFGGWGPIVVGNLSLCLIYELSHNKFHILPTCCHCTESSAKDKLAFKWGKLFSLCPLWITKRGALIAMRGGKMMAFLVLLTQKVLSKNMCSVFTSSTASDRQKLNLVAYNQNL